MARLNKHNRLLAKQGKQYGQVKSDHAQRTATEHMANNQVPIKGSHDYALRVGLISANLSAKGIGRSNPVHPKRLVTLTKVVRKY